MIQTKCKWWMNAAGVKKAVEKSMQKPLDKAAMLIEAEAKRSMKSGGGKAHRPSPAGQPPHVQTGNLRSSITWAKILNGRSRIIGPTTVAWYGVIHEFGGRYGKAYFPARPFMRPAIRSVREKFAELFANIPLRNDYDDKGPRSR